MKKTLKRTIHRIRQVYKVLLYLIRGDFQGLKKRIIESRNINLRNRHISSCNNWCIITTHHTLFIAELVATQLRKHNWKVEIITTIPAKFNHDYYVVICAQMFKPLPPKHKRIVFQLEQSISPRWFNDDYLDRLNNSFAVLEYSRINIDFLASKQISYPHVCYLPIGALIDKKPIKPEFKAYDVLFYGDHKSSPRRCKMLDALSKHFNVCIISEVFGEEMAGIIKQARIVINIHYYNNALLEMPRIQECLSLGIPVISEAAQDQDDYPELTGAVRFFEQGSIPAMIETVRTSLKNPVSEEQITKSVELSSRRFGFMFDRFLVGMNFLPASYVKQMPPPFPPDTVKLIALSLPETAERRHCFEQIKPNDTIIFDGIRRFPGWIGCGLSYLSLAHYAIKNGKNSITVMEDDVILPHDFESKLEIINQYLNTTKEEWDVFAGVIAVAHPNVKILNVEVFNNITFVTINKMVSTVFNIYNKKALHILSSWNPENLDVSSNTIDRFLENQTDLRVIITLPFFVGHREEVISTLWNFENSHYNDMISNSEETLKNLVLAYKTK